MEEKKYNFIMLVSIFTFLIIAIGYDSFLKNFDLRIINFIQGFESSELTIFYKSITDIADTWQSTILVFGTNNVNMWNNNVFYKKYI